MSNLLGEPVLYRELEYIQTQIGLKVKKSAGLPVKTEFKYPGIFLGWGVSSEDYGSGPSQFTVALVMVEDTGEVDQILPIDLKFANIQSVKN